MDSKKVKFRCFTGDTEQMIYDVFPVNDRVLIQRVRWSGEFKEHWVECDDVMQWTGLRDRNGKDIYEGDILGGAYSGCFFNWCDECKQITLKLRTGTDGDVCMQCNGDVPWLEIVEEAHACEVIGNIFEHANLLKGE